MVDLQRKNSGQVLSTNFSNVKEMLNNHFNIFHGKIFCDNVTYYLLRTLFMFKFIFLLLQSLPKNKNVFLDRYKLFQRYRLILRDSTIKRNKVVVSKQVIFYRKQNA